MDRGAERDDESRHFGADADFDRLCQRHGDRGCRRLRTEGRHVGGHHRAEHLQRILPCHEARDRELDQQQDDRHHEDNHDQLEENAQNTRYLPRLSHREEDAEDVEGQQRDDDLRDDTLDDEFEIIHHALELVAVDVSHAQSQHEGENEGGHHAHQRGHFDREERLHGCCGGFSRGAHLRTAQ